MNDNEERIVRKEAAKLREEVARLRADRDEWKDRGENAEAELESLLQKMAAVTECAFCGRSDNICFGVVICNDCYEDRQ